MLCSSAGVPAKPKRCRRSPNSASSFSVVSPAPPAGSRYWLQSPVGDSQGNRRLCLQLLGGLPGTAWCPLQKPFLVRDNATARMQLLLRGLPSTSCKQQMRALTSSGSEAGQQQGCSLSKDLVGTVCRRQQVRERGMLGLSWMGVSIRQFHYHHSLPRPAGQLRCQPGNNCQRER